MSSAQRLAQLIRSTLARSPDEASAEAPSPAAGAGEGATARREAFSASSSPPSGERGGDTHAAFDPGIMDVLAEKVLLAWLRNRHQLLFPFALNLRRLDGNQCELLVHAMVAA